MIFFSVHSLAGKMIAFITAAFSCLRSFSLLWNVGWERTSLLIGGFVA